MRLPAFFAALFMAAPALGQSSLSFSGSAGPFAALRKNGLATGPVASLQLGLDVAERAQVGIFALGVAARGPLSAPDDFALLAAGASIDFKLWRWAAADAELRWSWKLRLAGGYGVLAGKSSGPFLLAAPGVDYATRLRHFAIGVELPVAYAPGVWSAGVTPLIRYSF